jgi:flagellar M-ring protein FliF
MLQEVLGPGQAVVGVAAEINWDSLTRYEEKFDPEGQVIRTSSVNDETLDSTTAPGGGVTGVSGNANTETNATSTASVAAAPLNNSRTKKKNTDNQYEINRTISSLNQVGGGLKRLSASVFVAQRFEGTGAARKAVPRSPEEVQKIRKLVQNAVGIVENDPNRRDEIVVEEMVFNDQTGRELTQVLERQERRDFWVDLAQKLGYPLLGIGVLFFFWRTFQRTKTDDLPLGLALADLPGGPGTHGNGNGNGNGHGVGFPVSRRNEPGIVTVEVLNQLIRENPSNMTQAVRNWLSRSKPAK